MVKEFEVQQVFSVSVKTLFDVCFADGSFKSFFHSSKGDKDVDITNWIESPNTLQRVCFFTMIENEGKSEFETTRCLETQKCTTVPEWTHFTLESALRPENPMGSALFRIDSKWVASTLDSGCTMKVSVSVECTKKIWGVTGMVEGVLEKQAYSSHMRWFELAKQRLESHEKERMKAPEAPPPLQRELAVTSQTIPTTTIAPSSSVGHFRMRLSTYKRVVSGTEKLAQMLSAASLGAVSQEQESSPPFSSPMDIVIQPTVQEEHDDSDLKVEKKEKFRDQQRRWKERVALLVTLLLVAGLFVFYLRTRD